MLSQQTTPQPVPANQPFTITLEAQQWNAVMAALSEAPFKVAAPLIQAISEQLQGQQQPSPNGAGYGADLPPQPN